MDDTNETVSQETNNMTNTKKMNILLLYADDWRFDTLGIASNQTVHTPFLDQFSQEGLRFTHNCVTTSICWVSRASFYTGQYLSRHQSFLPKYPRFYQHWDNESFPGLLRSQGGYWVGHIGKWQFQNFQKELASKYDFARLYEGYHWYPNPVPGGPPIHSIDRNEKDALDFLQQRPKDQPFLLTVAFFPPHSVDGTTEQYFPQNKTMGLYQNTTLTIPNMADSWARLPREVFDERNEGRRRWHLRFDSQAKYQHMLKNYYRLVSGVDATCQRIVDELKKQGIYDETLVIFTADNGLYHGEKGLAGKWYAHQESIRIPLIISDPRMPSSLRNTTLDPFTLNIDIAPTILGAAGIPIPTTVQGKDLARVYLERGGSGIGQWEKEWRDDFFYEHPQINGGDDNSSIIPPSTGLVRKDWKYMAWASDNSTFYRHPKIEQLFNLISDPKEENDLAARVDHYQVLTAMRMRHDFLKEAVK